MAAPRLRSMPRNVTDVTRILAFVDDAIQNIPLSPDAGSVPLERTVRTVALLRTVRCQ